MTLNDYLDETARKYSHKNWRDLLSNGDTYYINKATAEASEAYAEDRCREQRILCNKHSSTLSGTVSNNILNAPLATEGNKK